MRNWRRTNKTSHNQETRLKRTKIRSTMRYQPLQRRWKMPLIITLALLMNLKIELISKTRKTEKWKWKSMGNTTSRIQSNRNMDALF